MDLVTQNLMASFKAEESLPVSTEDALLLEHFVNFCAVSKEYGEEFDVEDLHTGGGDDLGIDGIAVIVNGTLVQDLEEVDDLAQTNKYLEVDLVFCQAKSGSGFSGNEISNFFYGVKELLAAKPKISRNDRLAQKEALIRGIYGKSPFFKRGNPKVQMYFATTGKWVDDPKLSARIDTEREGAMELNIFGSVDFHPLDARGIQRLYASAKNRFSKSIEFTNKIALPTLPGIQESYLGYLTSDQYIKLITDDSGNIVRGLFYDNVRDFQWDNPVNKEIGETLKSEGRLHFVLMNNGITIVADSITRTGEQFTLEDFQIVNGCQTSHVLFHHRTELVNQIQVPVKLIVSKDRDIKNKIIKATNRQTLVKTEELTALTDFQKALEDYYDAIEGDSKLYYERRSQQFRSANGIEKMRVVSVPAQIRTFASMFLGLPHQASRYYGTLLKSIELTIFAPDHHPVAYYASSLALFRLESFMRRRSVDAKYRPFKYHLLSIVRSVIGGEQPSHLNSNKFEKYCEGIVKSLEDEKKCILAFQKACSVLDQVLAGDYGRDKAKDASIHTRASCHQGPC
jgi:hypothetical protein